ncbi:MAG: HAD-IA family hydrolase [Chloroflexota bacterium]
MLPLPSAILFDFDYTLADATAGIIACVAYALERLGLPPVAPAAVRRTVGLPLRETLGALGRPCDEATAAEFTRLFVEHADRVMLDATLFWPWARQAALALSADGLALGIVSTKFRHRIASVLQRDGLEACFRVVVGAEDVQALKPDPEGLRMAMARLGSGPRDTLYVGDSVTDAEAARRAGVPFVTVLSGATEETEFAAYAPLAVLRHVGELPAWLGRGG